MTKSTENSRFKMLYGLADLILITIIAILLFWKIFEKNVKKNP